MNYFVLLLLLISLNPVTECDCSPGPIIEGNLHGEMDLQRSYKISTITFYGKYNGNGNFKIFKFYKGETLLDDPHSISESEEMNLCGATFVENREYLVFGSLEDTGKLLTSMCLANFQIENEQQLDKLVKYMKQ